MEAALSVIGLFILRFGAPIAMIAFLTWALRRYERQEKARESLREERVPEKAEKAVTPTS